jgi:hypothetical protein
LTKLVTKRGTSLVWEKPDALKKLRVQYEVDKVYEPGIYGSGQCISKQVLNLVNGRMLKWGITIETLKMMKLDAVIQVKSLK